VDKDDININRQGDQSASDRRLAGVAAGDNGQLRIADDPTEKCADHIDLFLWCRHDNDIDPTGQGESSNSMNE